MRSILITGVCGVGKSTIAALLATELNLPHYDYADLMLAACPAIADKDAIEQLTPAERTEVYRRVDATLTEWFGPASGDPSTVLLENHITVFDAGTLRTFAPASWRIYAPVGLTVLSLDPPRHS